jgi:hypothetical protein
MRGKCMLGSKNEAVMEEISSFLAFRKSGSSFFRLFSARWVIFFYDYSSSKCE